MKDTNNQSKAVPSPNRDSKFAEQAKYTTKQSNALKRAKHILNDLGAEGYSLDIKGRKLEMKMDSSPLSDKLYEYTLALREEFKLNRDAVEIVFIDGKYSSYSTL